MSRFYLQIHVIINIQISSTDLLNSVHHFALSLSHSQSWRAEEKSGLYAADTLGPYLPAAEMQDVAVFRKSGLAFSDVEWSLDSINISWNPKWKTNQELQSRACCNCFQHHIFYFFQLCLLGLITVDHMTPSDTISSILFCHTNPLHVFLYFIHEPPLVCPLLLLVGSSIFVQHTPFIF